MYLVSNKLIIFHLCMNSLKDVLIIIYENIAVTQRHGVFTYLIHLKRPLPILIMGKAIMDVPLRWIMFS